ncbi:DUF4114 domain-containing protein [Flavobacterium psychrotrophum]|uniref:DUF4114 domain-containing protein n=1 Tax=Flavobacterium psychrotrophum TaxID=2294119 RepID=UPI000E30EA07|nr:DUF4114 domain-containing protein [Flavobacterium psychrotrophum]
MKRLLLLLTMVYGMSSYAQGYQFLSPYDSSGVPTMMETPDIISSTTMTLINNALPENHPVPVYNPQYITAGYDTDLQVMSTAEVWVTFVTEGAGYKNVLGFYTYDLSNPPTTIPANAAITIIFPNASLPNSGGNLASGSKVKIGTFPPNTGIGWVLLANAWNGTTVGAGAWKLFSNPNFNPEADVTLRHHNVLLNDPDNQRLILGFEDVKRDLASCDNDFNDAIFYVTANPYSALRTYNTADIADAAPVSSGNDGGLESNGSLANLVARRNFKRIKNNTFLNKKESQSSFAPIASSFQRNANTNSANLQSFFPVTGMYSTETAFESSPEDLIGITNADQIFSVDYYQGTDRVAAGLVTATTGSVYDHSKMICDRLNGSSLEDIRTITLQGHEIIMVKLRRASGVTEYALTFSVEQTQTTNLLRSYWNIAQYPAGDYLNFQVWGSTMGQVSSIVNFILDQLDQEAIVTSDVIENRIPSVFVKKGFYKNGQLSLEIINKSSSTILNFNGNRKQTELSQTEILTETVSLDGNYNQNLTVDTNGIFDIGFSIVADNSPREDGLYLADGPWGVDYNTDETTINNFNIEAYTPQASVNGIYPIERNAALTGEVKGTVNLFRNLLPGELALDATVYEALNFDLVSSHAVEVVMVTEGLTDWTSRLKFELPAQQSMGAKSILLNDFVSANGETFNGQLIKGFVFSVIGNYSTFEPFSINLSNMKLDNYSLGVKDVKATSSGKFYNYPNPFNSTTTLLLPAPSDKISVQVLDLTGRELVSRELKSENGIEVKLDNLNLPSGTYIIRAVTNDNKVYQSKCIVK